MRGELGQVKPLVITYDASVHAGSPVDPSGLGEVSAGQLYRETLAGLLAARAASHHFALGDHVVLVPATVGAR
jgi:hypothetical protein